MYQSYVYLEVRILLSNKCGVFNKVSDGSISIDKSVLDSVFALTSSLGCMLPEDSYIERLTGTLPSVPAEKNLTGCSVKVAEGGVLNVMFHARPKTVHIAEIRIEEDYGRLTHSNGETHFDYKWAGCPSLRIKTTPCFELGEEAELFLDEIRRLTQYLHIVNDQSSDGGIRCNAFVSMARYPELPVYTIKLRNLNSFNFVRNAINYELGRQESILEGGKDLDSESRLWNDRNNCTEFYKIRSAEIKHFEKIIPETKVNLNEYKKQSMIASLVELPEARRQRLRSQYGLSRLRAQFICDERARADYFENAVASGADPMNCAHWIASELTKLLNAGHVNISDCPVSAVEFGAVIKMLTEGKIHSVIAKKLLQLMMTTGKTAEEALKDLKVTLLADEKDILPYVHKVVEDNPELVGKLKSGQMSTLEYLTGLVMKKTGGMAVPETVKALIKQELRISIVYVLSFGGAISAARNSSGTITGGDTYILRELLNKAVPEVPTQVIRVGQFLSEELEPRDWGMLIAEIASRISAGTANGIVVTHGTDTLAYTAALLYWLFGSSDVPIVLTASSDLSGESSEAGANIALACRLACEKKRGVYVVFGKKVFSPLNLKFMRPSSDGFYNYSLGTDEEQAFVSKGALSAQFANITDPDGEVMGRILEEAARKMTMIRIYPGFRAEHYYSLLDGKVKSFFLELYDNGTANVRHGDFSIKSLLQRGKKKGIHFYCTSQQECRIDFSEYVTSLGIWKEGAVPMGALTTESAIALYYAASLLADSQKEVDSIMEEYSEASN